MEHPVTVTLDGATAVPVTASVSGRATQIDQASLHLERAFAGQIFAADVYDFGAKPAHVLFAQPSGAASTGTFGIFASFRMASPAGQARPYVYDVYHLMGHRVPPSMTYLITPTAQATMARVLARFYAINGNTAPFLEDRYGLTATGFLAIQYQSPVPGGTIRTDYLSTEEGIRWDQEAAPPFQLGGQDQTGLWVIEIPGFTHYASGSMQTADWARQPFRPGPYSRTKLSLSGCAPNPVIRFPGAIHVELTDLQDLPDGYDCLGGEFPLPPWVMATSRTMRLYVGNRLAGSHHASVADFLVPVAPGRYRLTYTDNTSAALPVSTRTQTTWTFNSAPARGRVVRIPLLLVNYYLPLGLDGHPDGSTAEFTVARVAGTPPSRVTGFRLWTSTDNGHTWHPASVRALGGGRFTAALPRVASGQAVSLRVQATDAGGSGIEQTIMTAYNG